MWIPFTHPPARSVYYTVRRRRTCMSCTELLPSSTALSWIGGILVGISLILFAASRPISIERIGAFGLEFKFQQAVNLPGFPGTRRPGVVVAIIGVLALLIGGAKAAFPATEWPDRLTDVCSAELQVSSVDDLMLVRVNDREVIAAKYGETPDWVDIKSLLRNGPNKIEIIIQNGQYGGCGGVLTVRLNGKIRPDSKWAWSQTVNQLPNVVCFAEVRTLNLH